MNEEYSNIYYTFFKNLQEMKAKPPWCLFKIYHMYDRTYGKTAHGEQLSV